METSMTVDLFSTSPCWTARHGLRVLNFCDLNEKPKILSEGKTLWFEDRIIDPNSFFCIQENQVDGVDENHPRQQLIRGREFLEDFLQFSLRDRELRVSPQRIIHFEQPEKLRLVYIESKYWMSHHNMEDVEVDIGQGDEEKWVSLEDYCKSRHLRDISIALSTEMLLLGSGIVEEEIILWEFRRHHMLQSDMWRLV